MSDKKKWIDVDQTTFNLDQVSDLMALISDELEELNEFKMNYRKHPSE